MDTSNLLDFLPIIQTSQIFTIAESGRRFIKHDIFNPTICTTCRRTLYFPQNKKNSKAERGDFNNNAIMLGDMTLLPRPILNFAVFGLGVIGPITHYFFKYLDVYVPPSAKASSKLSRTLVERLLLAPVLSLSTIVSLGLLQVSHSNNFTK